MTSSTALRFALGLSAMLLVAGCHRSGSAPPTGPQTYAAHGVIEKISDDRHVVTIHHQAIPGFMMEMTMDFPVRDAHLLDGYAAGDQVNFELHVADEDAWVDQIARTGHVAAPPAATAAPAALQPGDPLPDAEFLAEDGRRVHLSDFRGQVVAFTFFFTRCPLPTYCPLMNRNFAVTRDLLRADPQAPKNWELLSLSFDAAFDTSPVLKSYGDFYRHHDADRWLFAAMTPETLANFAAPLGLMVSRQDNNFTHNLRTIVVDPQGKLFRQFNDNAWKPADLAQVVMDAARAPAK